MVAGWARAEAVTARTAAARAKVAAARERAVSEACVYAQSACHFITLNLTLQVDEASGAAKDPAGFERRLLRVLSSLEEGARGQVDSK